VAVPDSHGAVLTRRGDPPAIVVGAERQGVHLPVVSPKGIQLLAGLHVPDLDRVPLASRSQPPAVRAEGDSHTIPRGPCLKRVTRFLLLVEALRVPEFHDPVAARRSEVLAITAKHQSEDFPFVGIERADLLAGFSIPYFYGSIESTRYQVAAAGAERH